MKKDIILDFGKFKGKTLQQVFEEKEYRYILWLHRNVEKVKVSEEMIEQCISRIEVEDFEYKAAFNPFFTENDSF